jgi:hypothetical protein
MHVHPDDASSKVLRNSGVLTQHLTASKLTRPGPPEGYGQLSLSFYRRILTTLQLIFFTWV